MTSPTVAAVSVSPEAARRLRRVASKVSAALEERDRLVVEAVRDGGTLREVGALVGLTHAGVKDIIRRKG